MSSTTLEMLHEKHRKKQFVKLMNFIFTAMVGIATSIAILKSTIFHPDIAVPVAVFNGIGFLLAGIIANRILSKPFYVTVEEFDQIEDEEGGFDRTLFELFQKSLGSRLMPSYEEFVKHAIEIGSSQDFDSAVRYFNGNYDGKFEVGQVTRYAFLDVLNLVQANRAAQKQRLEEKRKRTEQEVTCDTEGDEAELAIADRYPMTVMERLTRMSKLKLFISFFIPTFAVTSLISTLILVTLK